MRIKIILDTGGFMLRECKDKTYLDVGYFETPGPSDIEVSEDGKKPKARQHRKLGKGNGVILVEHVESDNKTVKSPVSLSDSFKDDILKKDDLYDKADVPDFIASEYDCILRFLSGDFESADVRARRFTEHHINDDSPTGKDKLTRPIANEIHVHYELADGEVLRLRRENGRALWSSDKVGNSAKVVEVKVLANQRINASYHKRALNHKAPHYYMPNSDPPPMDSQSGG